MPGERTPDTSTPGKHGGSNDDEISLREHLQRQLDSQVAAINRRIDDLVILLDERYQRQLEQVDRLAREQQEALDKAERATEKRFDAVNEFRQQLNDQAHTFMPRQESISRHERTQEQLEKVEQHFSADTAAINRRLDVLTGQIQGARDQKSEGRQSNAAVYAAIGFAVTILGAIVVIVNLVVANGGG